MESILDTIDEELSFEIGEDVEMMDIEEGEVVDKHESVVSNDLNEEQVKTNSHGGSPQTVKNKNKKRKKKKNKKKKAMPNSDNVDIDRFVLSVCKRLRERKSYLVYSAVGVLGVSALSDLVKEVDAIQACGGQKTALGNRNRTGGGVLWSILKVRDPNAYKEIMKKGKDFEKQFRWPISVQPPNATGAITSKAASTSDGDAELNTPADEQSALPSTVQKRGSVQDRIRVPVTYDDLPGE